MSDIRQPAEALDLSGHFDAMAQAASDVRPWPVPEHPWIAGMRWEQVLFLSWPVAEKDARRLVPAGLDLDLHEGRAYVSLLPLRMAHVHLRDMPPVPHLADFPELNLRTYVQRDGRPGVWFVSLDAPGSLFDWLARHLFHQPYFCADVDLQRGPSGKLTFTSRRREPDASPQFLVNYAPQGDPQQPPAGSLARFLCERYAMYARDHEGSFRRGDIQHSPWEIQEATVEFMYAEDFLKAAGLAPTGDPVVFYSERTDTVVWPLVSA
jgi:uncharacterized protein YqjF (DUF2071 family)